MNKEEKEYKSAVLQLQTALDFHNSNSLGEYNVNWKSVELILEYIENLQKKVELGEHYKHLYSEVKKQKDDVVEYIKESIKHPMYAENIIADCDGGRVENLDKLLRMLGETNEFE